MGHVFQRGGRCLISVNLHGVRYDKALSNLFLLKMCLIIAGDMDQMTLKVSFHNWCFCDHC